LFNLLNSGHHGVDDGLVVVVAKQDPRQRADVVGRAHEIHQRVDFRVAA
jgi:hypothetical protein